MCWLRAASSTCYAMFSIHCLLSFGICRFTSRPFPRYSLLSLCLILSDLMFNIFWLISDLCFNSFDDSALIHGFFFPFFLPRTSSADSTPHPLLYHYLFRPQPLVLQTCYSLLLHTSFCILELHFVAVKSLFTAQFSPLLLLLQLQLDICAH